MRASPTARPGLAKRLNKDVVLHRPLARDSPQPPGTTVPGGSMESLIQDIRLGVRRLAKSPVFTSVVVLTLALGIGATTTVFSAVNAVLLRPLPYRDPGKLAILWEYTTKIPDLDRMFVSYPDYLDWRARNTA